MKNKSRFVAFILSVVPGLSHLYLGITDRALTFFILFVGLFAGGASGSSLFPKFHILGPLLFIGLVIVWFIALVDAFSIIDNWRLGESGENTENRGLWVMNNRKITAVALSMIPGAGHMYLGLLKQGAQFMTAFFFIMFVANWLNIGFLTFILPVLWFYSLFDAYHLLEEEIDGLRPDESPLYDWLQTHPAWIGWGLIILGLLVILQKIVGPILVTLISASMLNYIETSIVALILIAGGVKMLTGINREKKTEEIQ